MEQAPDKSKSPPSTSYRETYRRHRKLFFVPVILGALVAGFIAFTSGGNYKSTASLWVDTAPPLASSVGASLDPPLSQPPAASEQGILTELLTTQAFASSVAKSSLLGKSLGSDASIQKNAPAYVEDKQVGSLVTGAQVLKITYTGSSAAMAQSVLGGIVEQLRVYNDGLSAHHDQAAVTYDKEQVNAAETALATARSNVNAYMAQHPNAGQSDPNLQSLTTAETNASTQLGQANTALAQATSPASPRPLDDSGRRSTWPRDFSGARQEEAARADPCRSVRRLAGQHPRGGRPDAGQEGDVGGRAPDRKVLRSERAAYRPPSVPHAVVARVDRICRSGPGWRRADGNSSSAEFRADRRPMTEWGMLLLVRVHRARSDRSA